MEIMKLEIPKVIARVDLGEYAPELKGKVFCVWVNPPLSVLIEYQRLAAVSVSSGADTGAGMEMLGWYSRLWSHGEDGTQWTAAELASLQEDDPAFLIWLIKRTWTARDDHMTPAKKK